jgi:hypothetical protein
METAGPPVVVRAKFYCANNVSNNAARPEDLGATITFLPVTSGSEENKSFYKWTPGGNIILSTINPDAAVQFIPGVEYYVDFVRADLNVFGEPKES